MWSSANGMGMRIRRPNGNLVNRLRAAVGSQELLFKIGRWSPDKRWNMAVEALAQERDRGRDLGAHGAASVLWLRWPCDRDGSPLTELPPMARSWCPGRFAADPRRGTGAGARTAGNPRRNAGRGGCCRD